MALQALTKFNNIAFLEVKVLAENSCQGWKMEYFSEFEGILIQKP